MNTNSENDKKLNQEEPVKDNLQPQNLLNPKFEAFIGELVKTSIRKFKIIDAKMVFLEMPNKKTWYIITNDLFCRLIEYERRRTHFVFRKLYTSQGYIHKATSQYLGATPRKFCVQLSKSLEKAYNLSVKQVENSTKDSSSEDVFEHLEPMSGNGFEDIVTTIDIDDNLDTILTKENEEVVLEENSGLDNIVNTLVANGEITAEQLNQLN